MIKHKKLIGSLLAISSLGVGAIVLATNIFSNPTVIKAKDTSNDIPVGEISAEETEKLSTFPKNFDEYLTNWEKNNPTLDKNKVGIEFLKDIYENQKELQNTDRYMGKLEEYENFDEFLIDWELMNPELDINVVGVDVLKETYEDQMNPKPFIIADEFDNNYKDFDEFLFNWEMVNSDLDKNKVGLHVLKEIYETRNSPTNPKWVDKFRN